MKLKSIKDKISGKLNKQNIKSFFEKQGLYVLIFLCVAAAGITAIIAWPRDESDTQTGDNGQDASVIEGNTLEEEIAAQKTPQLTVSPLPSPSVSQSVQPSPTQTTAPNNGSGKVTLKKPLTGTILRKFSGDTPVYYPSLGWWTTHNGVDIKADKGASVAAALSGTVAEAYTDDSNGGVVVITHSNNSKTLYAGLGKISVKKGDKVNAGDKIGEVGEMPCELDLSYHLHFEYIVDGVYKDPEKFF